MKRRFLALFLICACAVMPGLAHAQLDTGIAVPDPTRDPSAPEYSKEKPEALVENQLVGHAFVLMDGNSGDILFAKNENEKMYPAALTMVMTALVALEQGNVMDYLYVTQKAVDLPKDAALVPFAVDEQVTLQDALYGMLLRGGQDAALAIAECISPGDLAAFISLMNEKAKALGCQNTQFANAHGRHDENHWTTAADMALILDAALDNPVFRQIAGQRTYQLPATTKHPARTIESTNQLLDPQRDYYYEEAIGGRTGYTDSAAYTMAQAARRGEKELIAVSLYTGQYSRWADILRLFRYGFATIPSA